MEPAILARLAQREAVRDAGNAAPPLLGRAAIASHRRGEATVLGGDYTGVNIGIGGPPSLGTNLSFTSWPIFSAAKSQSTKLVIIDGPSSSVT